MAAQKAIEIRGPKEAQFITDRRLPKLRDDYILIKNAAIALNPTDWKHIDNMATAGALIGCDYAGTVEEVGPTVKKSFKKGDRVCGMVHGANRLQPEDGAFAEWIVAKGDLQMKMPAEMDFAQAASLGVGILTVGQGLYQSLQLPLPTEPAKEAFPILIYGGSTATGTLAIQFAKLSGLIVITTCSPRNNDLVRSLGADAIFDYNDPSCAQKIRDHANNNLFYAFDCISAGSSIKICADALSSSPPHDHKLQYSGLLGRKDFPREDVDVKATIAYSAVGEEMQFGGDGSTASILPARPADAEFAERFIQISESLLGEGKIKPHPPSMREGGLKAVLHGLQDMREGKVSGEKLVYRVANTP